MGTYTVQDVVDEGVVPTANAVAASDTFINDGNTILLVENGSGGSITVTITTTKTIEGLAVADQAVTIADGTEKAIGPFPKDLYNNSSGVVTVAYSGTTSVTAKCLRIPR